MINVVLKGMDIYLASDLEKKLTESLAKIMKVNEREIICSAMESLVYHGGIDQTSMHLYIDVECDKKYAKFESDVAKFLLELSKQFAIHSHVLFKYYDEINLHESIDHQYPLFLDEGNIANIETDQEEEENVDIFTGNAFEKYEHLLSEDESDDKNN